MKNVILVKVVTYDGRETRKISILRSTRGKHNAPKNEKKIGQFFGLVNHVEYQIRDWGCSVPNVNFLQAPEFSG